MDDNGVTGYRLDQDGELLADLDAQKRGHFVTNLEIGRTYEFRVQAGDAQNQWSSDGPSLRVGVEAGDAAGKWSTDGPRATVSTSGGAPECDGGLELASVSSDETPGAGTLALGWTDDGQFWGVADSERPALSADGRFVAFESIATNFVARDRNTCRLRLYHNGFTQTWSPDVFVRDRQAGLTERISLRQTGGEVEYGGGRQPDISGDGRYVVFVSPAEDLVTSDQNGVSDIFLRDRYSRTTRRLTVTQSGEEANGPSSAPRISADGSLVAFVSSADHLVSGDDNHVADIVVLDLGSRDFTGVSVATAGPRANGACWGPALSADGRFVAFASDASNLVPDDQNAAADVFVHDRQTGETTRVSVSSAGTEANGHSARVSGGMTGRSESRPALSADGRFVAFDSVASNLVPGDANWSSDIFVFAQDPGPPDQDGDGTPDVEEMGPEGDDPLYDGDGDGVPDHLEDNVTVRHTLDGQYDFRASTPLHTGMAQITPVAVPEPGGLPPGVILPFGVFAIQALGAVESGGELVLELEFPGGVPFNSWYQYGGPSDTPAPQWYEFVYDGQTGAELDGTRVILHLVDSERGDHDLLPDGNLLSLGGPAQVSGGLAAGLEVEPSELRLGGWTTEAQVTLRNTGQRGLVWAATEALPPWLRLEPNTGALIGGQSSSLQLLMRKRRRSQARGVFSPDASSPLHSSHESRHPAR